MDMQLLDAVPGLKLGINHYTKITVSESPQMLKGRLQLFQEQLFFELEDKVASPIFPAFKNGELSGKHLAQTLIVIVIPQKHLCDGLKNKTISIHSTMLST